MKRRKFITLLARQSLGRSQGILSGHPHRRAMGFFV
jgi:hypothetical protein